MLLQDLARQRCLFAENGQQEVPRADAVALQRLSLELHQFQDAFGGSQHRNLPGIHCRGRVVRTRFERIFYALFNMIDVNIQAIDYFNGRTSTSANDSKHQMLG